MSEHPDVKAEVRRYLIVFAALGGLTIITVAISYIHLPLLPAILLALFVAVIKASLVAGYFMHLLSEKKTIYLILGFTVFFFFGLLFLPMLEGRSVPEGTVHAKGGSPTIGKHAEHEASQADAETQTGHDMNNGGH